MIRYAAIIAESVVDGRGIRTTVFLQGCPRHCLGCHNPELLAMQGGIAIEEAELVREILAQLTPIHRGITFSGGDPLAQPDSLLKVVVMLRQARPDLDVWVYTGYEFNQVQELPIMQYIDVLVDGPFILAQKDLRLPFRGSKNQRLIDVKKTLVQGMIVDYVY